MNIIVFNNKNLADYGCYVASGNVGDSPERVVDVVEVPGKNGTLTIDGGRFRNVTLTYLCFIETEIEKNIRDLRSFLLSQSGYCRLEDDRNMDEFRLARYTNGFSIDKWDRRGGAFELVFDCDPRRFLKSGEQKITIESATTIKNPTMFKSKPLIRAYGTGSFALGDYTITISSADVYTDIDLETMNAYKNSTNCNANVSIPDNAGLDGGSINIVMSGITKLEIVPRWWQI